MRLEVPAEANKEIKEAVGKVHSMGDKPYWYSPPCTQLAAPMCLCC